MFHPRPNMTFLWRCNEHSGEVEADSEDAALSALRFMLGEYAVIDLEVIAEQQGDSICGKVLSSPGS